jgi:hypothetical protein
LASAEAVKVTTKETVARESVSLGLYNLQIQSNSGGGKCSSVGVSANSQDSIIIREEGGQLYFIISSVILFQISSQLVLRSAG